MVNITGISQKFKKPNGLSVLRMHLVILIYSMTVRHVESRLKRHSLDVTGGWHELGVGWSKLGNWVIKVWVGCLSWELYGINWGLGGIQ